MLHISSLTTKTVIPAIKLAGKQQKESAQKSGSEALQLLEIHPGGTKNRIDPVALSSFQPVTIHAMLLLQVSNPRLNRRSPFHPAQETSRRFAATTFIYVNLSLAFVSVPAISHINKDMLHFTGNPFNL